ncbi:hypothetical protein SAMN04487901_1305 [Prevotella communis]|uniref:Uncharacterized protein n=1 Tax=Prevotella communis TaxID=2913614 RepID=A0A1G8CGC1_9BACT|nr:hypothetical protein SAMN04487901_1305 [Prevotella communis]
MMRILAFFICNSLIISSLFVLSTNNYEKHLYTKMSSPIEFYLCTRNFKGRQKGAT